MITRDTRIEARVTNVTGDDPYAVTLPTEDDIKQKLKSKPLPSGETEHSVTFSISAWSEDNLPRSGDHVILWDVHWTDSGWRAEKACYHRGDP